MKFTRKKITGMEGKPEIILTQQPEGDEKPFPPFQIIVSAKGVQFTGSSCLITDMQDLQDFAEVVSAAWKDYADPQKGLRPRLVSPGAAPGAEH